MKKTSILLLMLTAGLIIVSCNKLSYRKTKSGMVYKLIPGEGKDSLLKLGQVAKFNVTTKLNDSVIYSSYGKVPGYAKLQPFGDAAYNLLEVLPMMRKGDSAITILMVDTLMKRGEQIPPNAKKGDRITIGIRITDVFTDDNSATADYNKESEKDRPRQMKEQQEEMAKMEKERKEQQLKEMAEYENSGEAAKEIQAMQSFIAQKKINAKKTGKGTFVEIKQEGTGAPANAGKYVNVKYTGKFLDSDSTFQSNAYAFQLGMGNVIVGWDEGLQLFKQGGKGTLYIPGFLAYGKNPPPGFKPFQPLKFDIEVLQVSDRVIVNKGQ